MKPLAPFALLSVLAAAVWAADDQYGFMPDGGRTLLTGLVQGMDPGTLRMVLAREADAADWAEWARVQAPDMDDVSAQTLAEYAALNLPLDDTSLGKASPQELTEALPQDGKDLAINQCQFCHSLFSGYLMHDRDRTGWKGTFKAPFHKEIPMSEVERDTFASYSALNMPLAFEDVPPELRF